MAHRDGFTATGPFDAVCDVCGQRVRRNALAYSGHVRGKRHQAALDKRDRLFIPRYSPAEARAAVERWNAAHPVGTAVVLLRDTGEELQTRTRAPAEIAESGAPVIWVDGVAGFYHLHRVRPAPGRVFLTRVQATYALGLLCSSQRREPAGVVVACRSRATGEVHEARPGEALHAQIATRVGGDLEDGWTVPGDSAAAAAVAKAQPG